LSAPQGTALNAWSALVLAAGGSRRFGAQKLLADLAGEPVIRRTAGAVCAVGFCETIVVTGAAHAAVRTTLGGLPCKVVHAANWAEGMSASIRVGIKALRQEREGLFLFLGDMPLVPDGLCAELADLAKSAGYAARPLRGDVPGHPVAFVSEAAADLMALSGDAGAGSLLRGAGAKIGYLPTNDEGVILDVDTLSDLARAERLWNARFTSDMIDSAISRGVLPRP
jgi:molybdenum cofactor cytidylyltransferase